MIRVSNETAVALNLELKARRLYDEVSGFIEGVYGSNSVDGIMDDDFSCLINVIQSIEHHRNIIITQAICSLENQQDSTIKVI